MAKNTKKSRGRIPPKERKPEEVKEVKRLSGLQRKRHLSSLSVGSASLSSIVGETRAQGFTIHPKTSQLVKRHVTRALAVGTIASERDVALSAAALVAGGMETAEQAGRKSIRPADVAQGWELIQTINCPPHRCLFRSVIERTDDLERTSPAFGRLIRGIRE